MAKYLLLFSLLACIACGSSDKNDTEGVYFAGEIVNPTSSHVVLYKNDMVVDSAELDANNHFKFNLAQIDKGLHHFDHSPELQYVFLEPGDSLTLRLNTVAFDESLVFSGTNGDVNNFLVEMFLSYEDEERFVYSLYKLHPEEFSTKIDSLRSLKLEELKTLKESNSISDDAYGMAKAAIDYSSFTYKEKYPFYHKKYTGEETIHELDDIYYDYRKEVNTNHEDLVYFRPYYDYMKYHFGNLSYMHCSKNCGMHTHKPIDYIHLNKHKLALIDSTIKHEELRNNLFRSVAMDVLLKEHDINEECKKFIEDFEKLSTNKTHHDEVQFVFNGIRDLQPKHVVPEVNLVTLNNNPITLKEVVGDGESIIYFWSGVQKRHFKNVSKHVRQLQQEKPDVKFIGICVQTSRNQWQKMVEDSGLDKESQFWSVDDDNVRKTLILDGLNKCIVTKDSLIENGFAYLYSL
ncbi:TlpA family protein disulfide reductase [Croceivirga thetidis]|uniref:Transaldolase n=1 Tax=Croceivirga thetidis TaxID=2721623 RepID=A0ABX1GRE4_9FLAO|nr:transaldolase [Croceivirga thetidis]NKI32522.1 transaldolase [Croceivirga thetidis]